MYKDFMELSVDDLLRINVSFQGMKGFQNSTFRPKD